jgi:hypothetical protein
VGRSPVLALVFSEYGSPHDDAQDSGVAGWVLSSSLGSPRCGHWLLAPAGPCWTQNKEIPEADLPLCVLTGQAVLGGQRTVQGGQDITESSTRDKRTITLVRVIGCGQSKLLLPGELCMAPDRQRLICVASAKCLWDRSGHWLGRGLDQEVGAGSR